MTMDVWTVSICIWQPWFFLLPFLLPDPRPNICVCHAAGITYNALTLSSCLDTRCLKPVNELLGFFIRETETGCAETTPKGVERHFANCLRKQQKMAGIFWPGYKRGFQVMNALLQMSMCMHSTIETMRCQACTTHNSNNNHYEKFDPRIYDLDCLHTKLIIWSWQVTAKPLHDKRKLCNNKENFFSACILNTT